MAVSPARTIALTGGSVVHEASAKFLSNVLGMLSLLELSSRAFPGGSVSGFQAMCAACSKVEEVLKTENTQNLYVALGSVPGAYQSVLALRLVEIAIKLRQYAYNREHTLVVANESLERQNAALRVTLNNLAPKDEEEEGKSSATEAGVAEIVGAR